MTGVEVKKKSSRSGKKNVAPGKKDGRPTKYKPEYDDMVIDWLSEGKTLYSFAEHIGVKTRTIWQWKTDRPSFLQAVKDGEVLKEIWGEQFILDNMTTLGLNNAPFIMYCRNYLKLKTKDVNKDDVSNLLAQIVKQYALPQNGRDNADS